jgi:hypothetical protein
MSGDTKASQVSPKDDGQESSERNVLVPSKVTAWSKEFTNWRQYLNILIVEGME